MNTGDETFETSNTKKPHRERHAGRKAEKKKHKLDPSSQSDKQKNPKAFAVGSAVQAARKFRRTQDLKQRKEHIPVVDRTPLEPPPILIAIVGPPKVGKSLLIKSLIKSYTRQPLTSMKGPVTLVTGKKRRITLIECNNDINCMVDIAKVADLVLLLIDASFGFEMEIFEFLNICQVHGMPKIMGVLTHLDMIKQTKKLQKVKKFLKHRFWKEVYPGAKLFYLSNLMHGAYLKNEVKNLARFISVMKFRPLVWQTSHPYILADRMEDTTPPEYIQLNPKTDRTVCFYGYMRGIPINKDSFIHIPGSGDYLINDITFLPDPCPLPEHLKKRNLLEKERVIYAPFSGVGGIVYDKDAVYVELPGTEITESKPNNELVTNLMKTKESVDYKLASSRVQLFSGGEALTASEFQQDNKSEVQINSPRQYVVKEGSDGRKRRKVIFNSSDKIEQDADENEDLIDTNEGDIEQRNQDWSECSSSEEDESTDNKKSNTHYPWSQGRDSLINENDCKGSDDEDDDNNAEVNDSEEEDLSGDNSDVETEDDDQSLDNTDLKWKSNLAEKAAKTFFDGNSKINLWKLVYCEDIYKNEGKKEDENVIGELFKIVKKDNEKIEEKHVLDGLDCSKHPILSPKDWDVDMVSESIRHCFVTGKWKDDADELLKLDDLSSKDEDVFGDFEDLETGEKFKGEEQQLSKEQLLEKKTKLKEKFNEQYDTKDFSEDYFEELKMQANRQAELNRRQFEDIDDAIRVQIEGFRAGMYVRIEIKNMPCEMVDNFDPTYPVVLGGLQPGEQNVGYVKVLLKKHRWYNRILKTKDPMIISMGWRRFQTIAVFSKQEDNFRHRMLKYTPEHVACMAHFWGPITRASTGFLALLSAGLAEVEPGFRIVATGSVVDTNQSTVVTKKLKLTGTPMKIYKKTAFINGMFNSTLEVAKFEGAKIKTVSGIRGQIKKPLTKPEGAFRATFEDKIRLSDIVFCRTWYQVEVPKLYVPITSLLLPISEKNTWKGMRTLGMLKREKGIRNQAEIDSMYTEITRVEKTPRPLAIPRALEKELPYKYKTKVQVKNTPGVPFMNKVKKVVVRDDHEARVASLIKKLSVNYDVKKEKLKQDMKQRMIEFKKSKQNLEMRKQKKHREIKKAVYRTLSKLETKKTTKTPKSKKK